MTTLQEAARKALYALEASIDGDHPYYEDQLTAIESLRTALAQQEADKPFQPDWVNYRQGVEDGKAEALLAQQGEQAKPVAYITDTHQGPMVWTPEMYGEACTYCDDGEFPVPLYTVAPQPTSGDYALGYAEGFNDACKPAPQAHPEVDGGEFVNGVWRGVAAPQPAQGVRVISVAQLSSMFRDTNTDKNQWGHYHAKGWNDALRQAMDYAALQSAQPVAQPMSDSEIEKLREKTFSTYNPYCPVDSKSMRKAVRAAEAAHGIREVK